MYQMYRVGAHYSKVTSVILNFKRYTSSDNFMSPDEISSRFPSGDMFNVHERLRINSGGKLVGNVFQISRFVNHGPTNNKLILSLHRP